MPAFLFTDIVGSTTRWEHQPQAMERALAAARSKLFPPKALR